MGNEINTEFIKAKQTYADFLAGNKDGELKATEKEAIARIKQVKLVERMIKQYAPDAVMSPKKSDDLAIPE